MLDNILHRKRAARFKTGVVDIDDLIVNTLGSLTGIVVYVILQQISFKIKSLRFTN